MIRRTGNDAIQNLVFKNVKVAHILPLMSRNGGGLLHSVSGLARTQAGLNGIDVEVFSGRDEYSDQDLRLWHSLTVHTASVVGPARLCYAPALRGMIECFGPDLIHSAAVWTWQAALVNQLHARRKTAFILSTRGTLDAWALRHSHWKKAVALWLFQQRHFDYAACIHALNEAEAQSIRAFGLTNPICIIPNGIDLPDLSSPPIASRLAQQESAAPSAFQHVSVSPLRVPPAFRPKVLLYLGRIHPKKGLVNLIRAWARVQASQPSSPEMQPSQWSLALAGWSENGHEAELKRLATELGIRWADVRDESELPARTPESASHPHLASERSFRTSEGLSSNLDPSSAPEDSRVAQDTPLLFLGPRFDESKAACYRACDAFILPSFGEGLPMAVLEAWANAKCVLMTPQCNLPEGFSVGAAIRIDHEPEGELLGGEEMHRKCFTSSRRTSLEGGLRQLFGISDASRLAIGIRGRDLVASHFAWPKIARDMKMVYDWILGGGSPPSCVRTM